MARYHLLMASQQQQQLFQPSPSQQEETIAIEWCLDHILLLQDLLVCNLAWCNIWYYINNSIASCPNPASDYFHIYPRIHHCSVIHSLSSHVGIYRRPWAELAMGIIKMLSSNWHFVYCIHSEQQCATLLNHVTSYLKLYIQEMIQSWLRYHQVLKMHEPIDITVASKAWKSHQHRQRQQSSWTSSSAIPTISLSHLSIKLV